MCSTHCIFHMSVSVLIVCPARKSLLQTHMFGVFVGGGGFLGFGVFVVVGLLVFFFFFFRFSRQGFSV